MKSLIIGLLAIASFNSFACDSGKQFCVNDKIISDKGLKGTIKAINPDQEVMVNI